MKEGLQKKTLAASPDIAAEGMAGPSRAQLQFKRSITGLPYDEQIQHLTPPRPRQLGPMAEPTPTQASGGSQPVQLLRDSGHELWGAHRDIYGECKARGEKLWALVGKSLTSSVGSSSPSTVQAETSIAQALPDTVTTVDESTSDLDGDMDEKEVGVCTKGTKIYEGEKEAPKFDNVIMPGSGSIVADCNQRRGYPKPNSEVLWWQTKFAAEAVGLDEEDQPGLALIHRQAILNEETKAVASLCVDSDESDYDQEFEPDDVEFMALLGTPNGRSGAFILIDHNKDMSKKKTLKAIYAIKENNSLNMYLQYEDAEQ